MSTTHQAADSTFDIFEMNDVHLRVHQHIDHPRWWFWCICSNDLVVVGADTYSQACDVARLEADYLGPLEGPYSDEHRATTAAEIAFADSLGFKLRDTLPRVEIVTDHAS